MWKTVKWRQCTGIMDIQKRRLDLAMVEVGREDVLEGFPEIETAVDRKAKEKEGVWGRRVLKREVKEQIWIFQKKSFDNSMKNKL
jgi:hypothetical protein